MIQLKDLFPNYLLNGAIFKTLNDMFDLPFKNKVDSVTLDIDYLLAYGQRGASRLVLECLEKYNGRVLDENETLVVDNNRRYVISNQGIYQIAKIIYARFGESWTRLYNTLSLQYNPIENYSMVETESVDSSNTANSSSTTGTNTERSMNQENSNSNEINTNNTDNVTESIKKDISSESTGSGETENSVFGFNSATAVPNASGTSGTTSSGTGTEETTGTTGTTGSGKTTNEGTGTIDTTENESTTGTNTSNTTGTGTTERELKRSGNIGVTTSQQMITSERELWIWDYFNTIYKQLNSILTIPYYESV